MNKNNKYNKNNYNNKFNYNNKLIKISDKNLN